jgi:hypothetical protein
VYFVQFECYGLCAYRDEVVGVSFVCVFHCAASHNASVILSDSAVSTAFRCGSLDCGLGEASAMKRTHAA